ncbi:MAG: ferritin [Candidatus Margulisiibacteriota bacterium]|jgi:ferritin
MISKKMTEAINDQIVAELYSAYLYLSMESYAKFVGLKGTATWFRVQAMEEFTHADKFFKYVLDQGGRVVLGAIAKPDSDFKSALDVFERTLAHEKIVTSRINKLATLAQKENDHASSAMLQWFITEQIEEEANPSEIIQQLKLLGKDGSGLFMIDQQLAARVFVPPATGTNTAP